MLSSVYITNAKTTVLRYDYHTLMHRYTYTLARTLTARHHYHSLNLRWVRSFRKKNPIAARFIIAMYQKHMGYVDRLDKNVSLSRIRLKRCMRRYHRAVFMWYLAIILNNVMVLFGLLFVDIEAFKKSKARLGYKHWFQNALGDYLIDHGIEVAETEWINRAATIVINFLRRVRVLKKLHLRRAQPSIQRLVLRDRTNRRQQSKRGRPPKRKRRGGRYKKVSLSRTHSLTHTSCYILT